MSRTGIRVVATLVVLGGAGPAWSAEHGHTGLVVFPDAAAVAYEPGPANLPKGTQISRVAGDPASRGRSCCG